MEQGDKRRGWVAIILLLVAVVCSTWVGIGIGRGIESSQTKRMLGAMSEDIARYNEFAKEAAALEEFVSGKDKMMQTVLSIRSHYLREGYTQNPLGTRPPL